MKVIPIMSVKGGTGKSTVCARLGLSLRDKGYRVGFLDIDVTGANLPSALSIPEPFPRVGLDTVNDKMIALKTGGYEVFSLAFRFGKAALMWKGGEQTIEAFGEIYHLTGTGRYELIKQMLTNVEFGEQDYFLVDCPPTTGDEVLSLLEHLKNMWGALLVCQPTNLAVQDIERALNMVELKKVPLIGMVGNMVSIECPNCGHTFSPFLDGGINLEEFCRQKNIPYLAGLPLYTSQERAVTDFAALAEKVISAKPVKIWKRSFTQKLEEAVLKGVIKGLFK